MEHEAGISDGEWNSLNGMYSISSTNKEADFLAQLLDNASNGSNISWSTPSSNMVNMLEYEDDNNANNNLYYYEGYGYCPNESHQVFVANINHPSLSMDNYFMVNDSKNANSLIDCGDDFLNQDVSNDSLESNHNINVPESSSDVTKKRSRGPVDGMQKNKRNVKAKKNQRLSSSSNDDDEEKNGVVLHRQNSMSCCSEDDATNASQEFNGRTTTSSTSKGPGNSKTRATRGSATDPQSLYARKRREKINERLRILQSLVPNGTKVDISTMLEEAVQYVKFLQLQIKLLSSDDLWMYAPIAYNGMDIGLDLKIATTKS